MPPPKGSKKVIRIFTIFLRFLKKKLKILRFCNKFCHWFSMPFWQKSNFLGQPDWSPRYPFPRPTLCCCYFFYWIACSKLGPMTYRAHTGRLVPFRLDQPPPPGSYPDRPCIGKRDDKNVATETQWCASWITIWTKFAAEPRDARRNFGIITTGVLLKIWTKIASKCKENAAKFLILLYKVFNVRF